MDQNEIEAKYLKKIKFLQKNNRYYYENSNPKISDQEYDKLKREILSLEKEYKFLDLKNSPSKMVGFKPSKNFTKVKHRVEMLSLGNAFNEEDLVNLKKNIKFFKFRS